MGIQIPGELADLLNQLGYTWPKSDEQALFEIGSMWIELGSEFDSIGADLDAAIAPVLGGMYGDAVDALRRRWELPDSAPSTLDLDRMGAPVVGGVVVLVAGVVLALKINVIIQLTILLIQIIQAIATAVPTFGASLAQIPIFKIITQVAVDFLINQAMEWILG